MFEWAMFETPLRVLWSGQERAILFFVLSGFVLSLPWLHGRPRAYRTFLLNRFLRLYPPYLIVMALAAAGAYCLGGHPIATAGLWFNQLGWSQPLSWRALPSVLFLLNDRSSDWLNESVWSLVWEARVVLIFPLLIWPIMRWKNAGIVADLAALAALHPALGLLLPHHLAAHFANLGTDLLYPEYFVLGVAVALNQGLIRRSLARGQGRAGLAVLLLGVAMFWVHWPAQNGRADGIAAALILAAALGSPAVARALEASVFLWLGRLSYSLYLIHVPVILTIMILFGGKVPLPFCAVMALICIASAEVFRRAVEAPSVRLTLALSRQSPAKKTTTSGLSPYAEPPETVHG
jgi:peptidoglycan/LPS O-acetylase OafA/YrhL